MNMGNHLWRWVSVCILGIGGISKAFAVDGVISLTHEQLQQKMLQAMQNPAGAYVDQLIDGSVAEDTPPEQLPFVSDEQAGDGLRSWEVQAGFRHTQSKTGANEQLQSLSLGTFQQTPDWGDIRLNAQLNRHTQDQKQAQQGGHFTLQQRGYVVSDVWTLDNTVGVNHLAQNKLISTSQRVNLPSRAFEGLSSRVYNKDTEVRLMAGEQGELDTVADFKRTAKRIVGVGVAQHLSPEWDAGIQAWQVSDADKQGQQQEFSASLRYRDTQQNEFKLQVLQSEQGQGVWVDGKYNQQRWQHQLGAYHLGEDLTWMGEDVESNVQGAYWRGNYSHPKYQSHTALDWQQQQDTQQRDVNLRQRVSWQWDHTTRVGGDMSLKLSQREQQHIRKTRSSAFVTKTLPQQSNRLQLSHNRTQGSQSGDEGQEYGVDYSHRWLVQDNHLGVQLAATRSDIRSAKQTRLRAGVSWEQQFSDERSLRAKVDASRAQTDDGDSDTALNYHLSTLQRLNNKWSVQASVDVNQNLDDESQERTAYLALNYRDSQGRALNRAGRRSGKIRGVVFYDDNADGIWQPLEKRASGVLVRLNDGSLPVSSNAQGEYEFQRVALGDYRVAVAEESVPLPWQVGDRSGYAVDVKLRQTQQVNLPLVKLGAEE